MKKYQIIYADPPWKFETYSIPKDGKRFNEKSTIWRNPDVHYPCMKMVDLMNLPVANIAEKDSCLFMWATYPMLDKALELVKNWGFTYKTVAFTWVKQNKSGLGWHFGTGYWTRANAEICLLGTKGKPHRVSASVPQLIFSPVMAHSRKPDEVRSRIVQLMGDLPRIELFARRKVDGWDAVGYDIDGKDIRQSIEELANA